MNRFSELEEIPDLRPITDVVYDNIQLENNKNHLKLILSIIQPETVEETIEESFENYSIPYLNSMISKYIVDNYWGTARETFSPELYEIITSYIETNSTYTNMNTQYVNTRETPSHMEIEEEEPSWNGTEWTNRPNANNENVHHVNNGFNANNGLHANVHNFPNTTMPNWLRIQRGLEPINETSNNYKNYYGNY